MPDATPILSLPLILPAQAQKHVTHNEALLLLDVLAQLVVLDRTRTAPPASPVEGDVHIVAPSPTGDWAGQAGRIATFWQGGWTFLAPRDGWRAWDLDQDGEVIFDGGQWQGAAARPLRVDRLGVNADADATNRLAVNAPATLFNHAGTGHQVKLNKASAADTASLLYQTGFSGRAEMGLAGEDDFSVKVSPDGTAWTTGLAINRTTGVVALPQGAAVTGQITGTAVTQTATDSTAGRLTRVGDFGLGGHAVSFTGSVDDATLPSGLYFVETSATGTKPLGLATNYGHLVVDRAATGARVSQTWTREGTGGLRCYCRYFVSAAWTPWREVFTQASLLGAVTQASGVPTGAVIERGANANGDFVRFADGTQICTRVNLSAANASTALGGLFASANVAWTFPAAFTSGIVVTASSESADSWVVMASAPTATSATLRVLAAVSKAGTLNFRAMAMGRWF